MPYYKGEVPVLDGLPASAEEALKIMQEREAAEQENLNVFQKAARMPTKQRQGRDIGIPSQEETLRAERRIFDLLTTYPVLSLSMIGLHVMPYCRAWRPIFEAMVKDGKVQRVALEGARGQVKQAFRVPGQGRRLVWID